MTSEYRKIELQSPADLTHIESNIRRAARQKLDLHLPQVEGGEEDELRKKAEDMIELFVKEVLMGVRKNVWVNGLDLDDVQGMHGDGHGGGNEDDWDRRELAKPEEEYEPFSESLRTQLATLHSRRDQLISQISAHRRTTPQLAAQNFQAQFLAQAEALDESYKKSLESAKSADAGFDAGALQVKRADEMQRTWEHALEGLNELGGGLAETRARVERAVGVVGYVEGKDGRKGL